MVDSFELHRWIHWFQILAELPQLGEDELDWTGRMTQAACEAAGAHRLVLVVPEAAGWRRLVATPLDVQANAGLPGEPYGWVGEVLAGRRVAGVHSDPAVDDPDWDGVRLEAGERAWGHGVKLDGEARGVLLAVGGGSLASCPLGALAAVIGQALTNRRRVAHLDRQVITDELTGAYNYRFLRVALRRELRRALRFQQPLSVLMLDVDHLKDYNDRYGHLRGSEVLKRLAETVRSGIRDIDLLAKYGGDEFLLILPHTDKVGAHVVAERLRAKVAEQVFRPLSPGEMTCSIGVAAYPVDADQSEQLIAAADRALFAAKRAGRNRVEAA